MIWWRGVAVPVVSVIIKMEEVEDIGGGGCMGMMNKYISSQVWQGKSKPMQPQGRSFCLYEGAVYLARTRLGHSYTYCEINRKQLVRDGFQQILPRSMQACTYMSETEDLGNFR